MKTITTEIHIIAPCDRVWSILTDFGSYPAWNPFIREILGRRPEVGSTLTVAITPPGGKTMRFKPRILKVQPPRELRWLGQLFVPGLFDGEHSFTLIAAGQGCLFRHSETFSGFLPMVMTSRMFDATERGFRAMNEALKERAEFA